MRVSTFLVKLELFQIRGYLSARYNIDYVKLNINIIPFLSFILLIAKINIKEVKIQIFNIDKLIIAKDSDKFLELLKKVEIRTAGMSVQVF